MPKKKTGAGPAGSPVARFLALPRHKRVAQLAALDKDFVATRPLNAAERRQWERAKSKRPGRGRPKVGQGAEKISLSVERGLLRQADALAKHRRISRAELVAAALEAELSRAKPG